MSRWLRRLEAAAVAMALLAAAPAAADERLIGEWLTASQSARIAIAPCAQDPALLCGRIAWLARPLRADGAPVIDGNNPDLTLRTRKLLGAEILSGLRAAAAGRWRGGKLYDPQAGRTYEAQLRLAGPEALEVKGCLLVFCETQTWRRTNQGAAGR